MLVVESTHNWDEGSTLCTKITRNIICCMRMYVKEIRLGSPAHQCSYWVVQGGDQKDKENLCACWPWSNSTENRDYPSAFKIV